jgi:uncharacterized membrane protein YdbT with pleckstrin-like domain
MQALSLDTDEKVVLEVRKHWFIFFAHGLFSLIAALAPLFVYGIVISYLKQTLAINADVSAVFWFLYSMWLLLVWISFFIQWTNYYLDVWYVTEKRIIDVEQKGLFHRQVSSLRFDKIQDISIEVRGILAHLFNFGDIHVQTAGQDSTDFVIQHAAYPERIRETIFGHHNKEAEKSFSVKIIDGDVTKKPKS